MDAYPLILLLPNQARAQLVSGSVAAGQPRYTLNGESIEVDVRIPEDLQGRWFWDGSFLRMAVPEGTCGLCIDTGTYPPPPIKAVRGSCFDAARETEATSARIATRGAERPAKKPHASRTEPRQEREIEPAQLELGL